MLMEFLQFYGEEFDYTKEGISLIDILNPIIPLDKLFAGC